MTNKEKVERLKEYRLLQLQHTVITQKEDKLYEEYLKLKEKINNPAAKIQIMSHTPSTPDVSNPIESNYIMLEEIEITVRKNIKNEARRLLDVVRQREVIEKAINMLDDEYHKAILDMRYIKGASWERIAVTVSYSYKHTKRLHWRAVEKIKL